MEKIVPGDQQIRQSALEFALSWSVGEDYTALQIIETADQFYRYIVDGTVPSTEAQVFTLSREES